MVGEDRTDVAVEIEVLLRGDGGVAPDEHHQDESAAITRSLLIEGVSSHHGMPNLIHESAAVSVPSNGVLIQLLPAFSW